MSGLRVFENLVCIYHIFKSICGVYHRINPPLELVPRSGRGRGAKNHRKL